MTLCLVECLLFWCTVYITAPKLYSLFLTAPNISLIFTITPFCDVFQNMLGGFFVGLLFIFVHCSSNCTIPLLMLFRALSRPLFSVHHVPFPRLKIKLDPTQYELSGCLVFSCRVVTLIVLSCSSTPLNSLTIKLLCFPLIRFFYGSFCFNKQTLCLFLLL
jgi:hypothetical protein